MFVRNFFLALLNCICIVVNAEMVNIGILSNQEVKRLVFSTSTGKYAIYTEKGKLTEIHLNDVVHIAIEESGVSIKGSDTDFGEFKQINIIGLDWQNTFKIRCISPDLKARTYEDNLLISQHSYYSYLQLINNIDIDNYIAGVVESEVGKSPSEEYFKLQAIICRTYALKNFTRHEAEGFQLCDKVHCQAYHGYPTSKVIHKAAVETKDIVIVDSEINLINSAFYSNCGGQTANSEDVWVTPLEYLESTIDSFCLHENNAKWRKTITKSEWESFLKQKGFYESDSLSEVCKYSFTQYSRLKNYSCGNINIPLTEIRSSFGLKSAYFSITPIENNLLMLNGRGFGHGVGLCQEGAMKMAKLGYNYAQILHYYYKNVHIVSRTNLPFFKE